MTRDLPFDDSDADETSGDAAYRVANGVARVARAGAYVTGGALIAGSANRGGNAPAITHDSKNVGWSQNDPQPDVPSPTVTFPDLTEATPQHFGAPGISPVGAPLFGPGADWHGTDAGMFPNSYDGGPQHDSPSGFQGIGLPDTTAPVLSNHYGLQPGWGLPLDTDDAQPAPGQPSVPAPAPDPQFSIPTAPDGTGVPGFHLPGLDGFHLPGLGGGLPGGGFGSGVDLSNLNHNFFDGVGAGHGFGPEAGHGFDPGAVDSGGTGLFVGTSWSADAHIGLDGVWFHSNLSVNVAAGHVGNELDAYNQQLGQGISHIPGPPAPSTGNPISLDPNGHAAAGAAGNAVGAEGLPGAMTLPGAPGATGAPAGTSGSPAGASGSPVGGAASPVSGLPSPVGTAAPTLGAVPTTAVAPVSISPVVAAVAPPSIPAPVAPVAVAQPVVATPLQTTIQPDAANQPIANLLSTHGGPSPLTVPAAAAPVLFDHARQPALATGHPNPPAHPTLVDKPLPSTVAPTTAPQISVPTTIAPVPTLTVVPTVPPVKVPNSDTDLTKVPVTTVPGTTAPVPTTRPHTPSDDGDTHGGVTITPPTDETEPTHPTVPTHQPDVPVPTVAPTQPDLPHGNQQPTVPLTTQPPVPVAPTTIAPVPQASPPQQAKPIADHYDSSNHLLPIADDSAPHPLLVHDAGLLLHDGGLMPSLLPDHGFADSHTPVHISGDHMLLL